MPAPVIDKILFFVYTLLLSAGVLGLVWCVSPFNPLHPAAVAAAAADTARQSALVPKVHKIAITGQPVRVIVAARGIDLPVEPGYYDALNATWTIGDSKAYYASPTDAPNNASGNTLIYGHNNPRVFQALHGIGPDTQAVIRTDNGYEFVYTYTRSKVVEPTDTAIFDYVGKPLLTLQTCSGDWNEVREFFFFRLRVIRKFDA